MKDSIVNKSKLVLKINSELNQPKFLASKPSHKKRGREETSDSLRPQKRPKTNRVQFGKVETKVIKNKEEHPVTISELPPVIIHSTPKITSFTYLYDAVLSDSSRILSRINRVSDTTKERLKDISVDDISRIHNSQKLQTIITRLIDNDPQNITCINLVVRNLICSFLKNEGSLSDKIESAYQMRDRVFSIYRKKQLQIPESIEVCCARITQCISYQFLQSLSDKTTAICDHVRSFSKFTDDTTTFIVKGERLDLLQDLWDILDIDKKTTPETVKNNIFQLLEILINTSTNTTYSIKNKLNDIDTVRNEFLEAGHHRYWESVLPIIPQLLFDDFKDDDDFTSEDIELFGNKMIDYTINDTTDPNKQSLFRFFIDKLIDRDLLDYVSYKILEQLVDQKEFKLLTIIIDFLEQSEWDKCKGLLESKKLTS